MSHQNNQPVFMRYKPVFIPNHGRLLFMMAGFSLFFMIIAFRLIDLGGVRSAAPVIAKTQSVEKVVARPDIVDRNGNLLATDIKTASAFADPSRIIDVDDMVEKLATVFNDINTEALRKKLSNRKSQFVWIKRGLTPKQQSTVHNLGLPGIHFTQEPHRVYPVGRLTSHVLGYVDIDNRGRSGIERYIDKMTGLYFPKVHNIGSKPVVTTSIDIGVQHILRKELKTAMSLYSAKAAAGVIMDVTSGEVIAMSSLPDFDPHKQEQALDTKRIDRISSGVFELGSIFKVVTTAMALDLGTVDINGGYDASQPLLIDGFKINDYHGKGRWLNVEEIFIYSSNIGSAKMAMDVGTVRHRAFLKKLGLLSPLTTELGVLQAPIIPRPWKKISTTTIAFGHGLSVTPLQFTAATAALVNGGYYVTPTFQKRSRADGLASARKVLKSQTSNRIRQLMRTNVMRGTGRRADAKGFRVGGKTGTAEKAINGRYDGNKLLTSFISVFPSDDPAYAVLIMLDEPQSAPGQKSRPTAGTNAARVTASVISKIGSKLGVVPVNPLNQM